MQGVPVPSHSHSMAKPGNAADASLWAKPLRGRAFALFERRCSSLIGNEPTMLLAPCSRVRKDSVAAARINQSFPRHRTMNYDYGSLPRSATWQLRE